MLRAMAINLNAQHTVFAIENKQVMVSKEHTLIHSGALPTKQLAALTTKLHI